MAGLTLSVSTELLLATLAAFFGAIGDWGIIRALHRVWIAIYTFAAMYLLALVLFPIIAFIVGLLDLILTAVPYVFDDGLPVGIGIVEAYVTVIEWTASNIGYSLSGMGDYDYRAGVV